MNVHDLKQFYNSRLGQRCTQLIQQKIYTLWPFLNDNSHNNSKEILTIGYPQNFINPDKIRANLIPQTLGQAPWPNSKNHNISFSANECKIPIADMTLDNVIAIHSLEFTQNHNAMLKEIWRILNNNGRLLIIVPARSGLWARSDNTPFGYGHPFSKQQMKKILTQNLFAKIAIETTMFSPPQLAQYTNNKISNTINKSAENILPYILPNLAGILILDYKKILTQPQKPKTIKIHQPMFKPSYA